MMASESKWKRQPLGRLAGYILRRLLADRALNTASALAYTSLMSLVPLLAVLL
ncbi:MAG TPA: hypothetical protein HPP80_09470, partial [Rhodospirillaceae bacterium]|nr:hypothetical protein [Rhodospirillaceae bacterium]